MKKAYYSALLSLIVLLLVSLSVLHHYYDKYKIEKAEKENVILLHSKAIEQVEHYKNAYGHIVAKNEAIVLENRDIKELVKNGNLAWMNELQGIKKNLKNLEFAYKITTHVMDSLSVMLLDTTRFYIVKGDTIRFEAKDWEYTDKWGKFSAKQLMPNKIDFKYDITVPLDGALIWKRKHPYLWILSKKEYSSELYSENPHVKVTELVNIKVKKHGNTR